MNKVTDKTQNASTVSPAVKGLLYGGTSYIMWGLFPAFWMLLSSVSALEIFAHRMLWAFVFMFLFVVFIRRLSIKSLLQDKRALLILGTSALIVSCNWFVYIYAVTNGHIVEAALGYYINPLISIILGVLIFKERLTLAQKAATCLAAVGVVYFTASYGSFPFIALFLAISFAVYGALKKKGAYPASEALTVESLFFVPLALVLIAITFFLPGRVFLADIGSVENLLLSGGLILGGVVTAVPLLLFALGANLIPLSWMGFLQYICPTISLLLGVFVYGEVFTLAHAICFGFIWAGLALISGEVIVKWRR